MIGKVKKSWSKSWSQKLVQRSKKLGQEPKNDFWQPKKQLWVSKTRGQKIIQRIQTFVMSSKMGYDYEKIV